MTKVCEHGIRHPWACHECDDAEWEASRSRVFKTALDIQIELARGVPSIGNYCKPCGENLLPEQPECPFCGQMAVPLDELPWIVGDTKPRASLKPSEVLALLEEQHGAMADMMALRRLSGNQQQREIAERAIAVWRKVERKLGQIRNLALSCEGHSYDLIVALADEALAAAAQRAKTAKLVEGEAPQSGGAEGAVTPNISISNPTETGE